MLQTDPAELRQAPIRHPARSKKAERRGPVQTRQVWEDSALPKRDRSIATCAILAAIYRTKELEFHLKFAQQNGVERDELLALISPIAFYVGWPTAVNAGRVALEILD
jgi:4-carboxymuconolactone decarboxylase